MREDMKPVFEYYTIENTTEYFNHTSGLYATLHAAESHLSEFADWWSRKGTGTIYHVWYTYDNDTVVEHKDFVKRVRYQCGEYVVETRAGGAI